MKDNILGGLSYRTFLRDYWQKKPLLVRNALPNFQGPLTRDALINLACTEDAQSRLIIKENKKWQLKQGPFILKDFNSFSKKKWTLLVQDVNHFLPAARDLLLQFNFIPYSRLDDLMVSYAQKGAGIGPHFDSYDVFLLQGMGRKRWQISTQKDNDLIANIPLKILNNFDSEQEWVLEPGDMLYLPPGYAHNGVAEDECMTYSIGFRSASYQELITHFLFYLQDNIEVSGIYSDPNIALQFHPARINSSMIHQVKIILNKIKWGDKDIKHFLGIYLTEPKSHIFFKRTSDPMTQSKFMLHIEKKGLQLNLKSRMLCREKTIYLNGYVHKINTNTYPLLEKFADHQTLSKIKNLDNKMVTLLYQWYLDGYIEIIKT
ncbi:MAG: cupin domain-containing protein [Nitrosospira sp.]|nr:cupin domain-containing protein [Nitrosospira sp.]